MAGTALMNRILLALSSRGVSAFRNNTGSGWAGKSFPLSAGQRYVARGGERVVLDARPLKAGLCKGSGDVVGFQSVTITPDMVGSRVAVFGSWESKDGKGTASQDQRRFAEHVKQAGGIGGVVRSEADALSTLRKD